MVEAALVGAGGVKYLINCAHKQPAAFLGLVGRVLPLQIAKADSGEHSFSFTWAPAIDAKPAMIEAKTAAIDPLAEAQSAIVED